MIIISTKEMACQACGEIVLLREYDGLEGGFYHDHFCKMMADWVRTNPTGDLYVKAVPA